MEIYQILILLLIYIIPIFYMNWYFKIAYSSNGRWYNLDKTVGDYIITYFPLINLIMVVCLIAYPGPKAFNYTNKKTNKKPKTKIK